MADDEQNRPDYLGRENEDRAAEERVRSAIRAQPGEEDDDDDLDEPFAADEDDDDDDRPSRPNRLDRVVPVDLKDDGFRGTRRAVYLGVFAVIVIILVGTIAGATLFHGDGSVSVVSRRADPPDGAPATPAPTPSSMFQKGPVASAAPFERPSAPPPAVAPPVSSSAMSSASATVGRTPALDPDAEAKRVMADGRHATSVMALEAAKQIEDTDPTVAAALADALARATGGAAKTVAQSGAGPQGYASTGGSPAPSPTPTVNPAFLGSSRSPVDLATVRVDTHEQFLTKQARDAGEPGYEDVSDATVLSFGTVVWLELYTDVNSELPGAVRAMVTRPVYDSATHSAIVIPPGAWFDGFYDARVVFGESRVLSGFSRIDFPGGKLVYRMGPQVGVDPSGATGIPADVDTHSGKAYRSAFALGILGGLASFLTPPATVFSVPTIAQSLLSQVGTQYANATTSQVNQQIAQPPTLKLHHGYVFPVVITHDLPMRPWTP